MTRLEQAITNIVDVFMEYAADETDDETTKSQKSKLNLQELKTLLETEIKSPDFQVREVKHSHNMHIHT